MIATPGAGVIMHRELIVALAARYRLPAVYPTRSHVMSGGLICYGIDEVEQFRRAAQYIDRILKGEKPADLPVARRALPMRPTPPRWAIGAVATGCNSVALAAGAQAPNANASPDAEPSGRRDKTSSAINEKPTQRR